MSAGSAGAQMAALLARLGESEKKLLDDNRDGVVDANEVTAAVSLADVDGDRTLDEEEIALLRAVLGDAPPTLEQGARLLAGTTDARAWKLLRSLEDEQAAALKILAAEEASLGTGPAPTASAAELARERDELDARAFQLSLSIHINAAAIEDLRARLGGAGPEKRLDDLKKKYGPDPGGELSETAVRALEDRIVSRQQDLASLERAVRDRLRRPSDVARLRSEIEDLETQLAGRRADAEACSASKKVEELGAIVGAARKELGIVEAAHARVDGQLPYARAKERVESLGSQISTVRSLVAQSEFRVDEALLRLFSGDAGSPEAVARALGGLPPGTVDRLAAEKLRNAEPDSDQAAVAAAVLRQAGTPEGRRLALDLHYGPLAFAEAAKEVDAAIRQAESIRDSGHVRKGSLLWTVPDPTAQKTLEAVLDQGIADARALQARGDAAGALEALRGRDGAYGKAHAILMQESKRLSALGDRIDTAIWATSVVQDLTVKSVDAAARSAGGPLAGAVADGLRRALASRSRGESGPEVLKSSTLAALEESESGLTGPGLQAFADGVVKGLSTLIDEKKGRSLKDVDWLNAIAAAVAEGALTFTTSVVAGAFAGSGDDPATKGLEDLVSELAQAGVRLKKPVEKALKEGLALELSEALTEVEGSEKSKVVFGWAARQLGLPEGVRPS